MNNLVSVFFGVPQSRYAALAILLAIIVVSLSILFSKDTIPVGQKFGFILLILLVSLPGLALSLFQLTCIVTGSGFRNKRWWCTAYAWIISAVMIFYAIVLVFAAVMSISAPKPTALARTLTPQQFNGMMQNANSYAATTMSNTPESIVNTNASNVNMNHAVPVSTPVSNLYPNNQNPMKTVPGPMYAPNPMSPPYAGMEMFTTTTPTPEKDKMSSPSPMSPPYAGMDMFTNPTPEKDKMSSPNPMSPPYAGMDMFTTTSPGQDKFATHAPSTSVIGGRSLPASYPGNSQSLLTYAPGASVNGLVLPLPKQPATEHFYAPAKFTGGGPSASVGPVSQVGPSVSADPSVASQYNNNK